MLWERSHDRFRQRLLPWPWHIHGHFRGDPVRPFAEYTAMTDTRQVLANAFAKLQPGIDRPDWLDFSTRFYRFLDAEAWTDAALMLVPEGWRVSNLSQHDHPLLRERGEWLCTLYPEGQLGKLRADFGNARCNHADHPALALAQACLKARENGDG